MCFITSCYVCMGGQCSINIQRSMFIMCVMSGTVADCNVEHRLPIGVLAWRLVIWHSLFNITSKILCEIVHWSLSWFPLHYHFAHMCAFSTEMHYFHNKSHLPESVSILQKIFHRKFNVVHFSCNYITYVKFNTNMLQKSSSLLINAPTCFDLNCWPSSGSLIFLACSSYTSTYMIGILHIM